MGCQNFHGLGKGFGHNRTAALTGRGRAIFTGDGFASRATVLTTHLGFEPIRHFIEHQLKLVRFRFRVIALAGIKGQQTTSPCQRAATGFSAAATVGQTGHGPHQSRIFLAAGVQGHHDALAGQLAQQLGRQGEAVRVGQPVVEGALVRSLILAPVRGDKVTVFKKKRRKNYRRNKGHRQPFTEIVIKSISA